MNIFVQENINNFYWEDDAAYTSKYYYNINGCRYLARQKNGCELTSGIFITQQGQDELCKDEYKFMNVCHKSILKSRALNERIGQIPLIVFIGLLLLLFVNVSDGFVIIGYISLLVWLIKVLYDYINIRSFEKASEIVASNEFYRLKLFCFRVNMYRKAVISPENSFLTEEDFLKKFSERYDNKGLLDYYLECEDEKEAMRKYDEQFVIFENEFNSIISGKCDWRSL